MSRLFMFVSLWPSCDSRMLNPTTTTKERIRRILVLLKLRRKKEKPAIFTAHLSPESTHAEPDRNSEHEHTRTRSTAQHIYEEPNGDPEAGSEETPSGSIHSACTQISDGPSVSPTAYPNLEKLLPDELLLNILEISTEYCGYIGMDIDPEVLYGQTPNLRRPPGAGWDILRQILKTRLTTVLSALCLKIQDIYIMYHTSPSLMRGTTIPSMTDTMNGLWKFLTGSRIFVD
ncbi:SubName: Full=Uncharacterized protein {ECO:0000313/EMBL:CCA71403.1}; Flags: Fragment [Serendipita indica DSM 11827]|nr:SubName: Full=Uncharacterized protein {ECO:0000313/EMBL:CCA71403.1}; Flags: Fragment [Serendipita indica DSM 11827]